MFGDLNVLAENLGVLGALVGFLLGSVGWVVLVQSKRNLNFEDFVALCGLGICDGVYGWGLGWCLGHILPIVLPPFILSCIIYVCVYVNATYRGA
jgi:hypothetical protein